MVGEDRRTSATILEDKTIEIKSRNRISEKYPDQGNVSVDSFNRYLLLTGEVPTEEMKQDIAVLVLEQRGLCRKTRQAIPAAIRKSMERCPEIAYALLNEGGLFSSL